MTFLLDLFIPDSLQNAVNDILMTVCSADQVLVTSDYHDFDVEVRIRGEKLIFVELVDLLQVLQGDGVLFRSASRLDTVPSDFLRGVNVEDQIDLQIQLRATSQVVDPVGDRLVLGV